MQWIYFSETYLKVKVTHFAVWKWLLVESHFGQFVSQIDLAGKKSIDASVELGQKISTFKFIFAPF